MLDADMVNAGPDVDAPMLNGDHSDHSAPSIELLERELPSVWDGQVPLRELITRVTQDIYADLVNLSET